jgi:hypothetical protein
MASLEDKKEALIRKIRLYADVETGEIGREDFDLAVTEVGIGIDKRTYDNWWKAFHTWGILHDTRKGTVVNPTFLEVKEKSREPRQAVPGAQEARV